MPDESACIFCRIAAGKMPAKIRYEDDQIIAFDDIHPSAPTHILLVPKSHFAGAEAIDLSHQDAIMALFATARKLIDELGLDGQWKLVANGPRYRHVEHFHLHLLGGNLKKDQLP